MLPRHQTIILLTILPILGLVTAASSGLGIAILFATVFTLLCFRWPFYSFCVVIIMGLLHNINIIYQSPLRITTERYSLGFIPVFILVMVVLVKIAAESKDNFINHAVGKPVFCKIRPGDYLILLFLLWSVATLFWSMDLYHGMNSIFNLLMGCCLYFLALYFLDSVPRVESFFRIIFIFGILLVGIFMVSNKVDTIHYSQKLFSNFFFDFGLITYGRRPGGFAPPQIAGNIMIFIFFIGCLLYVKAPPAVRAIIIALGFLFSSAILASGSKAAAGSFLISILAFIVIYPPLRKKAIWLLPAGLFLFICVLIFNTLILGSDRMTTGEDMNNLSLTLRLEFWQTGFDMLRQKIMGAGIGGFARLVDPWPGAHSFYFSILFDVGLIGCLILFVYFTGLIFKLYSLWQKKIDHPLVLYLYGMLAFWIAFLIHGTVDLAYFLPHIWLFLGIFTALLKTIESSTTCIHSCPARIVRVQEP